MLDQGQEDKEGKVCEYVGNGIGMWYVWME